MKGLFARLLGSLLLLGLLLALPARADIADINSAINKAGRERMLSQRMAKAYLQVGQGVDTLRSRRILDQSIGLFDLQLVELKQYAPNAEIQHTYLQLDKLWQAYKTALTGAAPSPEGGKRVLALSEEVLAVAHQGTVQLEKLSGTNAGRLVNLSGRQRMLSQRLAKFYQASAWGIADATVTSEFDKARGDFVAALKELSQAPANSPQIKEALELVNQQWFFFENALNQRGDNHNRQKLATSVATTSERILNEMEIVVGLYERASR